MHTTHDDVLAEQRVDNPERRAQQCDILDEHTVAVVGVDELRAQTVLSRKAAFLHIYTILGIFQQPGAGTHVLSDFALLPSVFFSSAPFPPCAVLAAAVDSALASDGDVILLVGIDTWLEVVAVETFPACRYDRIKLRLEHKLDYGSLFHMEVNLAF